MAKVSLPLAKAVMEDPEIWGWGFLAQRVGRPDDVIYRVTDGMQVAFFDPERTLEEVRNYFKDRAAQRSDAARRGAETRRRARDAT